MINKTELTLHVGASRSIMEQDAGHAAVSVANMKPRDSLTDKIALLDREAMLGLTP